MPNLKGLHELDIAPAQLVGGMRVRQSDNNHRIFKRKNTNKATDMDLEEDDESQKELDLEEERLRNRALKEKLIHDMAAHTASRQHNVMKNAGNNINQKFIHPTQPKSSNH